MAKTTLPQLIEKKRNGAKITVLTAYDYPTARIVDQAGIDVILVGDSLGNVCLGYPSTVPVTMEAMLHHTAAVVRGTENALVVGDMPFMSYQISDPEAVRNAGRFCQEAGADCVKLEGGRTMADRVAAIVRAGIPVMGHIGLTPQSATQLGGYKVQGNDPKAAELLLADATALESAGAFSIVLECVPAAVASRITSEVGVPTIGIGAGAGCDGQVLVFHDMVGLYDRFVPKFVKQYAKLAGTIREAVEAYKSDVESGHFPGKEHELGGS